MFAGPCPPCPQTVKVMCHCKKTKPELRRCGASEWSCGKPCMKTLSCGRHQCSLPCHKGSSFLFVFDDLYFIDLVSVGLVLC